jgi:hypothetical protein
VNRLVRTVINIAMTPASGWESLLVRTPLGRRDAASAVASWLSRPPLGVVLTAVFVVFVVVLVIAQL